MENNEVPVEQLEAALRALPDHGGAEHSRGLTTVDVDPRSLVDRIPAVIYVAGFGELGEWHYVSPHLERMLGFSVDEWQGDPSLWFRQLHPDDRARVLEEERESKRTATPLRSEYRMLGRDGRVVWVRDEAVLVLDADGTPLYWQGFMIEVTARKEAEQALHDSEARFRSLVDHVPMGLYRTTPDGRLVEANRALAQLLGYGDAQTLLSATVTDLYVDPSDRERWMEQIETQGVVKDFEMQLRRGDGGVIWIRDSGRAIRDAGDRVVYYEGALEDITRSKQAEWEARQANQQLSGWVAELERRNREMTLINEMGDMLQSCPDAEEAHAVMAHWAEQLFVGTSGALFVMAPSKNLVEPVAMWRDPTLVEQTFDPQDCWALRSGRAHLVDATASRLTCRHIGADRPTVSLCVPMMAQGEALGILHLQERSPSGRSGDGLRQLAVAVAEHLALALANLRLRESLRTQSIRDPLTGLFNRRYMEESLERELRRAARRSASVGVMMLDLDHFNRFNNTFGHQAGDSLLQSFGNLVRSMIRAEDIACRYGGEEFTLILPECPMEALVERAEQLRRAVQDLSLQHRGQSLGTVTVSIGLAASPEHGTHGEDVIGAADRALYAAKEHGRNQVSVAGS